MIRFFTKYLPVDGIITKGDYFLMGENKRVTLCEADKDAEYFTKEGYQKVKLFLCSDDIQVGDNVFLENGYNYFSKAIDKINNSDRDIILETMPENRKSGTIDYREMVKVLGEVSPDAIWIKNDMEFDKTDVQRYVIANDSLPVLPLAWGDELKSRHPDQYRDAYKFKCGNCKTFH